MADPDNRGAFQYADDIVGIQHFPDIVAVRFLADAQNVHKGVGDFPVDGVIVLPHSVLLAGELLIVHQKNRVGLGVFQHLFQAGGGVDDAVRLVILVLKRQHQHSVNRLLELLFQQVDDDADGAGAGAAGGGGDDQDGVGGIDIAIVADGGGDFAGIPPGLFRAIGVDLAGAAAAELVGGAQQDGVVVSLRYIFQTVQVAGAQVDGKNAPANRVAVRTGENPHVPVGPDPMPHRDELIGYIRPALAGPYDDQFHTLTPHGKGWQKHKVGYPPRFRPTLICLQRCPVNGWQWDRLPLQPLPIVAHPIVTQAIICKQFEPESFSLTLCPE